MPFICYYVKKAGEVSPGLSLYLIVLCCEIILDACAFLHFEKRSKGVSFACAENWEILLNHYMIFSKDRNSSLNDSHVSVMAIH